MHGCDDGGRWRASLSALVDGEPPELPRQQVEQHLASCAWCAEWLSRARAQRNLLRHGSGPAHDLTRHLVGISEAHICACHAGGECHCTDCVCPSCTCQA